MKEKINQTLSILANPKVTSLVNYLMFLNAHFSLLSLSTNWFVTNERVVLDDGCIIHQGSGFTLSESICGYQIEELEYAKGGFLEVSTSFEAIRIITFVVSLFCFSIFILRILSNTKMVWTNVFASLAAVLSVVDVVIYINLVNKINILQSGAFNNYGPGFIMHCCVTIFSFSILGLEFYSNFDKI